MSGVERLQIDEFDGTHGYVKVKAFVNYEVDLNAHSPGQKVMLGNTEESDDQLACVVFADDLTLEEGCGYWLGGYDNEWTDGKQIQLKICDNGFANKFYDPDEE